MKEKHTDTTWTVYFMPDGIKVMGKLDGSDSEVIDKNTVRIYRPNGETIEIQRRTSA